MSRGVDIICATPGRLNDLIKRNAIVSSSCGRGRGSII